uniref:Uncharacterized protein n=1 Tax=Chromera velia CCMP2878 TaxID=1169474 RepID=A0A0G4HGR5_9ALVE|eukprot:Cvel_6782.t1-p1 / transcript=Cvel_6782.t1 / gene=Cvel_6782 / organism=Chromera_velia_CCMP2878 / gene_product=hypothetical protein / transcript_product=hypothetical protein / location=Cvel_scaffold341:4020-5164(+) / protein_length=119 / sequence_SO=supercontig / SO=protein_coding / is_pseudo=false
MEHHLRGDLQERVTRVLIENDDEVLLIQQFCPRRRLACTCTSWADINDPNADIYFLDNQPVSPVAQGGWGKVVRIWKVGEPNNLCAKVVPKSLLKSGELVKRIETEFDTQVKLRSRLTV